MNTTSFKLLILLFLSISGFNCCTTICSKRTIEWESYIPLQIEDNLAIVESMEFKELQKKFPIQENTVDSFWNTISPIFTNWLNDYDTVFQGENFLLVKFRIDSTGRMNLFRILNTFDVDTNRTNILKENTKNNRLRIFYRSGIAIEFTIKVTKSANSIKTIRTGPIYSVIPGRSKNEILKVANSNLNAMQQAFQSQLNRSFCAHGKITVQFVVREDGTIPKCQIIESSYCDSTFENEIVELVSNWKFPVVLSTYDHTEIVYPFIFNRE